VQLNWRLHLGGRTGKKAGWQGAHVCQPLARDGTIFMLATLVENFMARDNLRDVEIVVRLKMKPILNSVCKIQLAQNKNHR
jgi:hypothetical protein